MELLARQRLLLSFLGVGSSPSAVTPIRIMKGVFLICERMPEEWLPATWKYEFVPYAYGPCSFEIYRDLDRLVATGLVRADDREGVSWKDYSLTPAGTRLSHEILGTVKPEARDFIARIRRYVSSVNFGQLLRAVYTAYPGYAVNSVFKAS